jgi:hypothetical protein
MDGLSVPPPAAPSAAGPADDRPGGSPRRSKRERPAPPRPPRPALPPPESVRRDGEDGHNLDLLT